MVALEYQTRPYRILISDDDESCRESVREALDTQGYCTDVVCCGHDAIEVVRQHLVHVVIVDMNMPGMDGLETVSIIRREVSVVMPSILISADNSRELVARAEQAQCDSFIPKPVDLHMLRDVVEELIGQYYR